MYVIISCHSGHAAPEWFGFERLRDKFAIRSQLYQRLFIIISTARAYGSSNLRKLDCFVLRRVGQALASYALFRAPVVTAVVIKVSICSVGRWSANDLQQRSFRPALPPAAILASDVVH